MGGWEGGWVRVEEYGGGGAGDRQGGGGIRLIGQKVPVFEIPMSAVYLPGIPEQKGSNPYLLIDM